MSASLHGSSGARWRRGSQGVYGREWEGVYGKKMRQKDFPRLVLAVRLFFVPGR